MPSWAARQILDCAVEACDPLFRVELAESDPRGAAILTLQPRPRPAIPVSPAQTKIKKIRSLRNIARALEAAGYGLVPAGWAPFEVEQVGARAPWYDSAKATGLGVTAILPEYRLAQHNEISVLVEADLRYQDKDRAQAAGYTWDYSTQKWRRVLLRDDLDAHKKEINFPITVMAVYKRHAAIMIPDDEPAKSADPVSRAGRAWAAQRKTFAGGRPKKIRKCTYCQQPFGARDLRAHLPACRSNPRRGSGA